MVAAAAIAVSFLWERDDDARPPSNQANSPEWLGAMYEFRSGAARARATPSPPYLSQPVDITDPGRYEIVAGPVVSPVSTVTGWAVSLPEDAADYFTWTLDVGDPAALMVDRPDGQYVSIPLIVSEVRRDYRGLRAWVQ